MISRPIISTVLTGLLLALLFPLGLQAQETSRRAVPPAGLGQPMPAVGGAPGGMVLPGPMLADVESRFMQKQEVQQKLQKIIEKVDFQETPLVDVFENLRQVSGLNIHVHWESLSASGIEKTQLITMQLHDVTVQKTLRMVLESLSAGYYSAQIDYIVDENVITIASKENLAKISEAAFPQEKAKQTEMKLDLIERMQKICLDPAAVALIASAGLKDDVSRSRTDIIADLEDLLAKTKTLGLRNAIRLTLRDLYKSTGNNEKVLEHLRAMLTENDAAIEHQQQSAEARQEITDLKAENLALQSKILEQSVQIQQLQAMIAQQAKQIEALKK